MFRRLCAFALLVSPSLAFGANKDIQELQRDIAQLQDTVNQMRRSQDEKLAALTALVQQALNGSNDANKAVAVIQANLQQSLSNIETKVSVPVANLNTRMDSLAGDMRTMQGSVSDLTAVINRVQTTLQDVSNQLKVLQTPAPAPPPAPGASPQQGAAAQPDVPPMSATDLYANADRDYRAGRLDMALDEYKQFLKYYGDTAQAADAQFYIGYIHYSQNDYETAAKDFDLVLEKYPTDNKRAPEARYFKGMSLLKIAGHKTEAAQEFKDLIKLYPRTDYSAKACTELQNLGLRCSAPAAPKSKAAPKATKKK